MTICERIESVYEDVFPAVAAIAAQWAMLLVLLELA